MFYDSFSAFNSTEKYPLESPEYHILKNIHWGSQKLTVIVVLLYFGEYNIVSNEY